MGVYHFLPYSVSKIHSCAISYSITGVVCIFSLVSLGGGKHDGGYSTSGGFVECPWIQKPDALAEGVDTDIFKPSDKSFLDDPRPIWIYVDRVAVEKNIEAYLQLDVPGSKYVIVNGPAFNELNKKYKDVKFTGYKFGKDLAHHIAAADVFVFPSKTDTFGIVMLEAMACDTPVAAYPVSGPIDVVENGVTGYLDRDLKKAALGALELDASRCLKQASEYTWRKASSMFLSNFAPVGNA